MLEQEIAFRPGLGWSLDLSDVRWGALVVDLQGGVPRTEPRLICTVLSCVYMYCTYTYACSTEYLLSFVAGEVAVHGLLGSYLHLNLCLPDILPNSSGCFNPGPASLPPSVQFMLLRKSPHPCLIFASPCTEFQSSFLPLIIEFSTLITYTCN